MPTSRYASSTIIGSPRYYATSSAVANIRAGVANGTIQYTETTLTGGQRLDTIAGREYGDARYWWIIAAASNIGWGLQVPPGTLIRVPSLQSALESIF